jgi:hypothetical protein
LKAALLQKISTLSSKRCHTLGDWKDEIVGKYVRATVPLVSTEGQFIPIGSTGHVEASRRTINTNTQSKEEKWYIKWDHLPSKSSSIHMELKYMEPVPKPGKKKKRKPTPGNQVPVYSNFRSGRLVY